MEFCETGHTDLWLIKPKNFEDKRGLFLKTFHKQSFVDKRAETNFVESYYSISHKNVLRGMHYQSPPYEHSKLIYVTAGEILDVVLDLRKNEPTYGKCFDKKLSQKNGLVIYVPKGFAHGFLSLEDNTTVVYMQTSMYEPDYDCGIKWDSFGFNWNIETPIISERDKDFIDFSELDPPF